MASKTLRKNNTDSKDVFIMTATPDHKYNIIKRKDSMSRTITAIAIFIVIIGLAIFESAYTINVSEQVKNELSTALEEFLDETRNRLKTY